MQMSRKRGHVIPWTEDKESFAQADCVPFPPNEADEFKRRDIADRNALLSSSLCEIFRGIPLWDGNLLSVIMSFARFSSIRFTRPPHAFVNGKCLETRYGCLLYARPSLDSKFITFRLLCQDTDDDPDPTVALFSDSVRRLCSSHDCDNEAPCTFESIGQAASGPDWKSIVFQLTISLDEIPDGTWHVYPCHHPIQVKDPELARQLLDQDREMSRLHWSWCRRVHNEFCAHCRERDQQSAKKRARLIRFHPPPKK